MKFLKLILSLLVFGNYQTFAAENDQFLITDFSIKRVEVEDDVVCNTLKVAHNGGNGVRLEYSIVEGSGELSKYGEYDIVTAESEVIKVKVIATTKSKLSAEATTTLRNNSRDIKGYYKKSALWAEAVKSAKGNRLAYTIPENVDEKLPNVLLIGTSISVGYTLPVRQNLEGVANVYRIPDNAGSTETGLANIEYWLSDMEWDVMHINWGLHDLKYVKSDSSQDVPPAQYQKNLRELLTYIQNHSSAKLIWAQTTFVPAGVDPRRDQGDDQLYNNRALAVLTDFPDIVIDDHYKLTSENQDLQRPKNVHFTVEGYKKLADQVSGYIKEALK